MICHSCLLCRPRLNGNPNFITDSPYRGPALLSGSSFHTRRPLVKASLRTYVYLLANSSHISRICTTDSTEPILILASELAEQYGIKSALKPSQGQHGYTLVYNHPIPKSPSEKGSEVDTAKQSAEFNLNEAVIWPEVPGDQGTFVHSSSRSTSRSSNAAAATAPANTTTVTSSSDIPLEGTTSYFQGFTSAVSLLHTPPTPAVPPPAAAAAATLAAAAEATPAAVAETAVAAETTAAAATPTAPSPAATPPTGAAAEVLLQVPLPLCLSHNLPGCSPAAAADPALQHLLHQDLSNYSWEVNIGVLLMWAVRQPPYTTLGKWAGLRVGFGYVQGLALKGVTMHHSAPTCLQFRCRGEGYKKIINWGHL